MRGKSSQTLAVSNVFDLFLNATILAFSGVIAHQYQFRAYASSAGHDRGRVCPSPPHGGGLRYPQVESARQRQPCSVFVPLSAPDCTSADVVNWPEQISAVWGICYADHLLLNAQQPCRHHKGRDGF